MTSATGGAANSAPAPPPMRAYSNKMKIAFKILAVMAAILLFVAMIFLLPQHRQIRSITPALPIEAELRSLLSIANGPTRVSYLTTSSQPTNRGDLGHTSAIIEWADGRLLVIDTGMDASAALEFGELMALLAGGGEVQVYGTLREILGEAHKRVAAVALTHLHIDHSQGIGDFCVDRRPGTLLLQSGQQAREHNAHTREGAWIAANSCLEQRIIEAVGLTSLADFPGVAIYPLGGHTPGSTLFAVADGERLLLFSGDITNSLSAITDDHGKGFLYSYLLVPEDTARTAQLRHWLRQLDSRADISVVVSHDLGNVREVLPPYLPQGG